MPTLEERAEDLSGYTNARPEQFLEQALRHLAAVRAEGRCEGMEEAAKIAHSFDNCQIHIEGCPATVAGAIYAAIGGDAK